MLSLAFYGFLYYTSRDMFQQFNKKNMPEPQRLVIIKRTTANPMYIGYRTDKNFDVTESNKNTSWFGSKITDLGKCSFGQHNFGYAFNDATVSEWCYLDSYLNAREEMKVLLAEKKSIQAEMDKIVQDECFETGKEQDKGYYKIYTRQSEITEQIEKLIEKL